MQLKTLKNQVEYCLKFKKENRNNDVDLTIDVWKTFYREHLDGDFVELKQLHNLPTQDSVKRIRAKFQNDEFLYLPTKLDVARTRKINEDEWRKALGYTPLHGQEQMFDRL